MEKILAEAEKWLAERKRLSDFEIWREGEELHLRKGGESFIRLLHVAGTDGWRMEVFRQAGRWDIVEFSGTLEECLEYVTEEDHYRFWKG